MCCFKFTKTYTLCKITSQNSLKHSHRFLNANNQVPAFRNLKYKIVSLGAIPDVKTNIKPVLDRGIAV